jgi:peptide/nickel transport system substrate-binding protein
MFQVLTPAADNIIEAPEAVALEGGTITNWQYCVGTGPWIITDVVTGTSITFSRNPNYWGYDERHPENQLPYADTIKLLSIPEESTRIAALRSGQVDISNDVNNEGIVGWQLAQSLAETNPELQQIMVLQWGYSLLMAANSEPFTDLNVRKAMQLAINLPELAQTYYGGAVEGTPCGMVSTTYNGWYYPYDEWPQELKDEYSYNPDLARELLTEAAQDGLFEVNEYGGFDTNVVTGSASDLQLLQVIQSELLDIGVNMEINTMDPTAVFSYCIEGKNDGFFFNFGTNLTWPLSVMATARMSTSPMNFTHCNDPVYDEIANRFINAMTMDEARQALYEADKRNIEQHWAVQLLARPSYIIYQPYLKGYSGEIMSYGQGALWARLWIDRSLKK